MAEQLYKYVWGNNNSAAGIYRKRHLQGRLCRILARGSMNSCLIEFVDNGEQLNCSLNALRKADAPPEGELQASRPSSRGVSPKVDTESTENTENKKSGLQLNLF